MVGNVGTWQAGGAQDHPALSGHVVMDEASLGKGYNPHNDKITARRDSDGNVVYHLPPSQQETTTMQKIFGESTFLSMSLAGAALVVNRLFHYAVADPALNLSEVGAQAGTSVFSNMSTAAFSGFTPVLAALGGAIAVGGAINYFVGEKKKERGEEIKPPSYVNTGIVHGLVSGFSLGAGLTMVTAFAANWMAGAAALATISAPALVPLALVAGVATGVYQAYKRSTKMHDVQAKRYDSAQYQYKVQEGKISPSKARTRSAQKELSKEKARENTKLTAAGAAVAAGTGIIPGESAAEAIASATSDNLAQDNPETNPHEETLAGEKLQHGAWAQKVSGGSLSATHMDTAQNF